VLKAERLYRQRQTPERLTPRCLQCTTPRTPKRRGKPTPISVVQSNCLTRIARFTFLPVATAMSQKSSQNDTSHIQTSRAFSPDEQPSPHSSRATHTHTTGDNQSTSTYNFIPQQSMPKPHRPPRLTANVTQIYAGPYTLRSDRPNLTLPSLTDQTGCFAVRLEAPPVQTRIDASQVLGLHSAHTHRMGTRG
jgi:hypothetical protein